MRQAVIYARISRDRVGAGLGVDRQLADCRDLAEQLGWNIVAERTDNDLSAYSGKPRPGYRAVLSDITAGRVDAVIAWHTDRLHRSPIELEEYISTCDPRGVPTHCVKAGPVDLSTPSGRLVARQLGAVARYEVEHMIERQKSAKAQAARDGRYRGGRRAFGYEPDGVTVRESEADIVRAIARQVLAGMSMSAIAAELNRDGITGTMGGQWTGASVRDVVIKPRVAGLVEHHGDIVGPAQWPALLDDDTWRGVRSILTDSARVVPRAHARRWIGSSLYLCGRCGATVRIASAGRNKPYARPYYRCSGKAMHVARVAETVDDQVTRTVLARLALPDAAGLGQQTSDTTDTAALHSEANAVRARLDELTDSFAHGAIDARALARGSVSLHAQLDDLDRRIGAAYAGSALDGLTSSDADDLAARWAGFTIDRRRDVIDALATVTILPGTRGRKPGGGYDDPDSIRIDWKGAET